MSEETKNSGMGESPAKESAAKEGAAARSIRKGGARSKKKKDDAV